MSGPTLSGAYLTHFRARLFQDAFTEAYAGCLNRRAETFEAVAEHIHTTNRCPASQCAGLGAGTPHRDFIGHAGAAGHDDVTTRALESAVALRNRASGVDGTALRTLIETATDMATADVDPTGAAA